MLLVPETAAGHPHSLVLVLADGDDGDDLVAVQPRGLDPFFDELRQSLAQQREAPGVVLALGKVAVQDTANRQSNKRQTHNSLVRQTKTRHGGSFSYE